MTYFCTTAIFYLLLDRVRCGVLYLRGEGTSHNNKHKQRSKLLSTTVEEAYVEVKDKPLILNIPDTDDLIGIAEFNVTLDKNQGVRGVTTLRRYFTKYLQSAALANKHYARMQKTLQVMSGVRAPRQRKETSITKAAWVFFDKLPTNQLRAQCTLFGLDYDSFDTVDERIDALVNKFVTSANGSSD